MLTRLEVDGFKNLQDLVVDFGALSCITGPNASGKSNVLDAIEFLRLLAWCPISDAARSVRGGRRDDMADERDLLRREPTGEASTVGEYPRIRLGAEMILPPVVTDDFGQEVKPTVTFVRYEIELAYDPSAWRLVLERESLLPIARSEAAERLPRLRHHKEFLDGALQGQRFGRPFISTRGEDDEAAVRIHRDRGDSTLCPLAHRMHNTALKGARGSDFPTVLATRREMQGWRRLALNPAAISEPATYLALGRIRDNADAYLSHDGSGLAALLYAAAAISGQPDEVYGRVRDRLNTMTGAAARRVLVADDDSRQRIALVVENPQGVRTPARALSDGMLRFLALCILPEAPRVQSLLCVEHPENGIHSGNTQAVADVLRDLAVDARVAPSPTNPLTQVIVTTHSSSLGSALDRDNGTLVQRHLDQFDATRQFALQDEAQQPA